MKLILSILKKEDELATIQALNEHNFFVTKISTSGGFLKQKNSTLLIGTEEADVDRAVSIIRKFSGTRKSTIYSNPSLGVGVSGVGANVSIPVDLDVGGSTLFILDVVDFKKL